MAQVATTNSSSPSPQALTGPGLNDAGRDADNAVAADTQDLKAHIQRIRLHWQRRDGVAAFGALVDLFLVLGDKGISLRSRILRRCEDLLSTEQRVFLLQNLDSGLVETAELPPGTASVIRPAPAGDLAAIHDSGSDSVTFDLAQEYIRLDWPDLATELLQELIDAQGGNEAARSALAQLE